MNIIRASYFFFYYRKANFLIGLFLISTWALYLKYFSVTYSGSFELRFTILMIILAFFWPLWLAEDLFHLQSPIGLFLAPRQNKYKVIISYLCSRVMISIFLGLTVSVISVNTALLNVSMAKLTAIFLYIFFITIILSLVSALTAIYIQGKLHVLVLYLYYFMCLILQKDPGYTKTLGFFIMPRWLFNAEYLIHIKKIDIFSVLQAASCVLFIAVLFMILFNRSYKRI